MVEPRSVIETAHRLEALTKADHGRGAKGHDPLHHAHGGDGGVSVWHGGVVQADGGNAGQALPGQGGKTALDNQLHIAPIPPEAGETDGDVSAAGTAIEQQAEAGKLADNGSPGRAGHAHVKDEHQQRIQADVQHRAADNADGAVDGVPLEAQLVVEHQGGGHPRGAQQNDTQIFLGIGQDGWRGAQERGQRRQEDFAQNADGKPREQGQEEPGGGHVGSFLRMMLAQLPGDKVSAAVAKEESHSLDHCHHGEHHAHSTGGGIAFQHADEKGIRHVVKGCDQHAENTGDRQAADQPAHRLLCELMEFQLLLFVHGEILLSCFLDISTCIHCNV